MLYTEAEARGVSQKDEFEFLRFFHTFFSDKWAKISVTGAAVN